MNVLELSDSFYTEKYMGEPTDEDNESGYNVSSLVTYTQM